MIRQPERIEGLNSDSYVAFLVGLSSEGNVPDMEKALSAALMIREKYRSEVSLFCRQVKVAGDGMERHDQLAGMRECCFSSLIKKVRH